MEKDYGETPSGIPITEELIQQWSAEAERGFDVDAILARRRAREAAENAPEGDDPPPQP